MVGGLHHRPVLVKLQEDFLRQVFRQRRLFEEVERQAENHRLMLAHDFREGGGLASREPSEQSFSRIDRLFRQPVLPLSSNYVTGTEMGPIFYLLRYMRTAISPQQKLR